MTEQHEDAALRQPIDTAQLRALAEKATPGPWTIELGEDGDEFSCYIFGQIPSGSTIVAFVEHEDEAKYIAAADPATILSLLDLADRHAALVSAVKAANWNEAARLAGEG